jgi:hypothetical protein
MSAFISQQPIMRLSGNCIRCCTCTLHCGGDDAALWAARVQ